jgi:hypothetical protein
MDDELLAIMNNPGTNTPTNPITCIKTPTNIVKVAHHRRPRKARILPNSSAKVHPKKITSCKIPVIIME